MKTDIKSLRRLSDSQYAQIGRTTHLLATIEYELFRTISAAFGSPEANEVNIAARGTFRQRLKALGNKLKSDQRIRPDLLQKTLEKLETASILRDQFFHGLWVAHEGQLTCKFIKRHDGNDGSKGVALQTIAIAAEKFALIHRNLEYILVELDVIQEILVNE